MTKQIPMKQTTKDFLKTAEDGSVTNLKLACEILVEARFGEDFRSKISKEIPSYALLYPDTFGEDSFDIETESHKGDFEGLGLLGKITAGFHTKQNSKEISKESLEDLYLKSMDEFGEVYKNLADTKDLDELHKKAYANVKRNFNGFYGMHDPSGSMNNVPPFDFASIQKNFQNITGTSESSEDDSFDVDSFYKSLLKYGLHNRLKHKTNSDETQEKTEDGEELP